MLKDLMVYNSHWFFPIVFIVILVTYGYIKKVSFISFTMLNLLLSLVAIYGFVLDNRRNVIQKEIDIEKRELSITFARYTVIPHIHKYFVTDPDTLRVSDEILKALGDFSEDSNYKNFESHTLDLLVDKAWKVGMNLSDLKRKAEERIEKISSLQDKLVLFQPIPFILFIYPWMGGLALILSIGRVKSEENA